LFLSLGRSAVNTSGLPRTRGKGCVAPVDEDVTFIDMWPAHVDERGELKQDPRHITELRLN
jgi:hypothetical protein